MITKQFKDALKEISSTLDYKVYPWTLVGSTNLGLQRMDTNPCDLDLVMRLTDLKVIRKKFQKYNPSAVEELFPDTGDPAWSAKLKRCPVYNVHFNMWEVRVQILRERDDGDYLSKLIAHQLTYINLEDSQIPCFTLEAEAQTYEDTYRLDKAKRVRDFLESLQEATQCIAYRHMS